jgi:very-short-patch-repair endonuclease
VTIPARTIADLRRVALEQARRALRQAAVIGLGIPEDPDADSTRSELEAKFLALCRRHRLPSPEVNVRVGRHLVDFLWRAQSLVVETDGYRYHRGRQAFEDDRARDVELRLAGFDVVRFSHRQVTGEPRRVVVALRALLADR